MVAAAAEGAAEGAAPGGTRAGRRGKGGGRAASHRPALRLGATSGMESSNARAGWAGQQRMSKGHITCHAMACHHMGDRARSKWHPTACIAPQSRPTTA